MRRTQQQEAALQRLIRRTMRHYTPPKQITVSQWAAESRILGSENAEPGPWQNERTPYMVEIMDAFTDPAVREITMVAGAQIGKSEAILNMIGYGVDIDPGSMLYMQPTVDDCKRFSRLRIAQLVRTTRSLRGKIGDGKFRDSGDTLMQKMFPGGTLILVGTNAPSGLASTPCRDVFADEVDRFAPSAGNEGDPLSLATARTISFHNSKVVAASTPTEASRSPIIKRFLTGTRERWHHECPECGGLFTFKFSDLIFEKDEQTVSGRKEVTVRRVDWQCPGCKQIISQRRAKRSPARWIAEKPAAIAKRHRSFWITPLDSPWMSWEEIAQRWYDAQGDVLKLRSVTNTYLGEAWEDKGEIPDPAGLLARRESYGETADGRRVEVPAGALVLTCGVDTQNDRLEYEIVGYGRANESWGIRRGILLGDPNDEDVWLALDEVLDREYLRADGSTARVEYTFVDSGGQRTDAVYFQCGKRFHRHVFAIKGFAGDGKPLAKKPKQLDIVRNQRHLGKIWLYDLGVDTGKSLIFSRLAVRTPGPGYQHYPLAEEAGYDYAYFDGLCSEVQVLKVRNGVGIWAWEKLPGHERNEPLDLRNYANAAFFALAPDLDARARELREGRKPAKTPTGRRGRTVRGNLDG